MRQFLLTAALFPALLAAGCHMYDGAKSSASTIDEAEMMAKWMEYGTPNEAHERLANKVGRWNLKLVSYVHDAPPQESSASSEMKWTLDGRFIEDTTTGDMGGMPFHGRGLTGYDNIKQMYVGMWVDNMMTGIVTSEGTYDAESKSFTYASQMPDPMSGQHVPVRQVERWIDVDHFVFEMWVSDERGNETKQMEIQYTRAR